MKNSYRYQLPVLFSIIIIFPTFYALTGIWEFERRDENRVFRDSLIFDVRRLNKFPNESEEFINDNFAFRRPLLDFYHHIKFDYFKVPPHPDRTIMGTEGWYFSANKEKDVFEGKLDFSEEELKMYSDEWGKRKEYLDTLNTKFYWIICPLKHYVYPEYLPFNILKPKKKRRVDQLKNHLHADLPEFIIDPTEAFLESKASQKLYFKLDNHWNSRSSSIVAEMLLEKIKIDFPNHNFRNTPKFDWKDSTTQGGRHYRALGIDELFESNDFPKTDIINTMEVEKYGFPPVEHFPYPHEYERRFINKTDKSGLKILFIRDSFALLLIPYVIDSFSESLFIFDSWRYQLNEPIIEKYKPDIVVFFSIESNLENVIMNYSD